MGAKRFVAPGFLFIAGFIVAFQLILMITESMPPRNWFPTAMSQSLGFDIMWIVVIAIPLLFIEYYIFAVPLPVLILLLTKAVKTKRYELNIMNISSNFGGTQMVRRAAIPALFSVAFADQIRGPLQAFVFGSYVPPGELEPFFLIVVSLMSALLLMPVALLLFMPTWVLNDAGVVTHLKSDNLELRQCPDTQGVGRWISNMLGGYAILAFPITMFLTNFYNPLIVPLFEGTIDLTVPAQAELFMFKAVVGFLWTLGLPFFVMAFILPVIVFNEGMQSRSTIRILRLAKRLGAKIVRKERIQEIKRPTTVATEESATAELWARATMPASVVSSQKSKDNKKKKDKSKSKVVTSRKTTKKKPAKKKKK
ncbi:MAG: hypothetical protein ACXAB5_08340 [Candidatus Thorarchaeota archaeon]|jgi:hypothetical protein